MKQQSVHAETPFVKTHMQINFLEAAGLILNDLSQSQLDATVAEADALHMEALRTQSLRSFFKAPAFIELLQRVKETMASRGEVARGKVEVIVDQKGGVLIDSGRSNLQLHDQEQIRREVVRVVYLLQNHSLAMPSQDYSLSFSL